jgi:FkbM family methyltransferase
MEPVITRAERESFLERAEELSPLIGFDTDDGRFLLSTFDRQVTTSLVLKTSRAEMKTLRRALAVLDAVGNPVRRGTFLEVGANIGTTTVPALRSHGFKRAVACEPEPRNLFLLELNLVANRLEHDVEICRAAIGEADGEVELLVSERRGGVHEVRAGDSPLPRWTANPWEAITVRRCALDTLADRGVFAPDDIGLMWMDAEGHEGHILKGAHCVTELGVPIVTELNPEKLGCHGGLDDLLEIARTCYTHFVRLRHLHGRSELRFDLDPTDRLGEEIEWLTDGSRHTDVLLIRDPRSRPAATARPRRPAPPHAARALPPDPTRPLREPDQIPVNEREAFVRQARPLTPLIATRLDGAMFIARTAAEADELSLFVNRSHPHLRLLEDALAALDELGLGEGCRRKTFVQASSGAGIATVAALCASGFARGFACEPDLWTYRVLKLNMTTNGLTERVRTLPVALDGESSDAEPDSLDGLLRRGLIDAAGVGLLWITDGDVMRTLAGAADTLGHGPPLLLELEEQAGSELVDLLQTTHTHCVPIGEAASASRQPAPLTARGPDGHVLVVRLP